MKFAALLLSSIALIATPGCQVMSGRPDIVQPSKIDTMPSYDGGAQNSGIVASHALGFVVTPHFRDRYNNLIETYGDRFEVELHKDAGLTRDPNHEALWVIDNQHMSYFLTMNRWFKSGVK